MLDDLDELADRGVPRWSDFFTSLVYLTAPEMYTVPLALHSFLDTTSGIN